MERRGHRRTTIEQADQGADLDDIRAGIETSRDGSLVMGTVAERQVAHIWKRLGFGARGSDIDGGVAVGPQALITDLLSRPLTTATDWKFTTATGWVGQSKFLGQQLSLMGSGANPLQERLAWILQGLVVVGLDGTVYFPDLVAHLLRLRGNPLGSYKKLLADVTVMRTRASTPTKTMAGNSWSFSRSGSPIRAPVRRTTTRPTYGRSLGPSPGTRSTGRPEPWPSTRASLMPATRTSSASPGGTRV